MTTQDKPNLSNYKPRAAGFERLNDLKQQHLAVDREREALVSAPREDLQVRKLAEEVRRSGLVAVPADQDQTDKIRKLTIQRQVLAEAIRQQEGEMVKLNSEASHFEAERLKLKDVHKARLAEVAKDAKALSKSFGALRELYATLEDAGINFAAIGGRLDYRHNPGRPDAKPGDADHPSPLSEWIQELREAGFKV